MAGSVNDAGVIPQDELIDISSAVERGYCSRATIMRDIKSGKLPAVKIKHRNYLRISDLEARNTSSPVFNLDAMYEHLLGQVQTVAPLFTDEQRKMLADALCLDA